MKSILFLIFTVGIISCSGISSKDSKKEAIWPNVNGYKIELQYKFIDGEVGSDEGKLFTKLMVYPADENLKKLTMDEFVKTFRKSSSKIVINFIDDDEFIHFQLFYYPGSHYITYYLNEDDITVKYILLEKDKYIKTNDYSNVSNVSIRY